MPIAWHPKKVLDARRREKRQNQFLPSIAFDVCNLRLLEHFDTEDFT